MFAQPALMAVDGSRMVLLIDYFYVTSTNKVITVPAGFIFDGNSTLVNKFKPSRQAASLIHDYLYRFAKYDDGTICTRLEADQIYYTMLKGTTYKITRAFFFAGLRLFGWIAWNRHRKND